MRSFIGWVGGKSHLKNQIISLIPGDCERYIEVCGGAGWVLFGSCDVADILEYQPNKIKKTGTNLILEQNGNRKKE